MRSTKHIEPAVGQTRTSIRVPRKLGRDALQLLTRTGLLDRRLKVKTEKDVLILPLVRSLDSQERDSLERHLGMLTLGEEEFQPRTDIPRSLEEALADKLPPRLIASLPGSFDIIGDIAVVELPPELESHQKVLAEGIMEVHKNVQVVMAKAGAISGVERVRPIRLLAGENRTVTVHKELGCRFKVDLARAYFTPRLSHEHQRVSEMVQPGECVADLFAGVGPFSILIGKRLENVEVHAVDANPEAVRLIEENIRLNKPKGKITVWPGDARKVVDEHLARNASRVIMNYPSAARDYVDVGCKALRSEGGILHYYTFADGLDCADKAVEELKQGLIEADAKLDHLEGVRKVRGVAPMHWQVVVDARIVPS